jgi:Protein of unknown function (DUF3237)
MSMEKAPDLRPLCRITCEVGALVSLGEAPGGERRYVPLGGGTVVGPDLNGSVVEGGIDWQWRRADDVLEIGAHYVLRAEDGGLIEVKSEGLRHGRPEVMAALARGEAVPASAYFFRTFVRFTTGAPAWSHLNRTMAIAVGQREAQRVVLDLFSLG